MTFEEMDIFLKRIRSAWRHSKSENFVDFVHIVLFNRPDADLDYGCVSKISNDEFASLAEKVSGAPPFESVEQVVENLPDYVISAISSLYKDGKKIQAVKIVHGHLGKKSLLLAKNVVEAIYPGPWKVWERYDS